jgi:hypothetical protein
MILIMITAVMCGTTTAQSNVKWRGSDGWGVSGQYQQFFNTYNLQTVTGQITRIDTVTPLLDMAYGIMLIVKTDREEIPVHLGPAWFLIHQDMNLTAKDNVEVKGLRVSINGKTAIVAAEVRRGDRVLQLRDEDGLPYWCSWRIKKL